MPVMHKARDALPVDHHLGRHASQLKQIDFLAVTLEHAGGGVRQADEGQCVLFPIRLELSRAFRSDDHDLRVAGYELIIVLAQLRHMRTAEWSHKATIENKQYVLTAAEISQAYRVAVEIA
jgi:hypothetical protein